MPGLGPILDETRDDETAEDSFKLLLPSELSAEDRDAWCRPDIPTLEFRFRFAQADDTLAELRHIRRLVQSFKDQRAKHPHLSQGTQTRTQGLAEGFQARIRRCANRYSHARNAMLALDPDQSLKPGWMRRFQKLNDSDIRGPGPEDDNTSEGRFVSSWIWLVPRLNNPNPPAATSSDNPDTTATVSDEPTSANDASLTEFMRAHWAKCQARAERYEEEVTLTVEEMGRTLRYFEWKRSWWLSLLSERAQSDSPPPADVQRGLQAYAHRQSSIYSTLIVSFANRWRKILLSHKLRPTWLSQYPDVMDPLSSGPSRGHSRPETKSAKGTVNPQSTRAKGAPSPSPAPQLHSEDADAPLMDSAEAGDDEDGDNDGGDYGDNDDDDDDDDGEYVVDDAELFDLED